MVVQWGNRQLLGKVVGGTVVLRPNNLKDEELQERTMPLHCFTVKVKL